jgi:hypothetical protein
LGWIKEHPEYKQKGYEDERFPAPIEKALTEIFDPQYLQMESHGAVHYIGNSDRILQSLGYLNNFCSSLIAKAESQLQDEKSQGSAPESPRPK